MAVLFAGVKPEIKLWNPYTFYFEKNSPYLIWKKIKVIRGRIVGEIPREKP